MKQRKKLGRKILGVLLTLAMIIGLMPGMSLTAWADTKEVTITFKSSGSPSDGSSALDSVDMIIDSGASYVSSLSASKVYNGKDGCGIKLGSSSQAGSLTLNLSSPMTVNAITVEAKKYSAIDSCGLTIQDKTYDGVSSDFGTFTYTYAQPTEISSVALSSTGKRIYIKSVTLIGQAEAATAYADYDVTTDANKTKSGDDLTALQVTFNGKPWYIIEDNSTAVDAGTVTLLAAESLGYSRFHDSSSAYSTSTIRTTLDNMTASGGSFAEVASAINTVSVKGSESDTAVESKLWLLSVDEAKNVPENVRKFSIEWWLRSPGNYDERAAFVDNGDGDVDANGIGVRSTQGVRPALQLDLSKVTFDSETKTFTVPQAVTEYRLWVADVQVTSANMDDVLGDKDSGATVTFTPATTGDAPTPAVLTLKDATITDYFAGVSVRYGVNDSLIVNLEGDNTIGQDSDDGLYTGIEVRGSLTIKGSGKLAVKGRYNGIKSDGDITIESGEITASGLNGGIESGNEKEITINGGKVSAKGNTGIIGYGGVTIVGAEVNAEGENYAVFTADKDVTITGGTVNATATGTGTWQKAINGTVKNSISGTGWTDAAGTEGQTEIAISTEGQDLSSYKKVLFREEPPHTHNFTYSAKDATITATCTADGCDLTDSKATLTIVAPELNVYGGTESAEATISGSIPGVTTPDIVYSEGKKTLDAAPTNAGTYTASITIEGKTASVEYTIAKADPTFTKTVSITPSDFKSDDTTTKDGVTVATHTYTNPNGMSLMNGGTFTSSVGNITKIEMTAQNSPSGEGWSDGTWSGNSSSVSFGNTVYYFTEIVVTIESNPVPGELTATYGDTLANITLPTGWTWADDTQSVGSVGTKTFKATFTPEDTDNYNVLENLDVTVTVNKADNPATIKEIEPIVTKGGNTVDLSALIDLNGATGDVAYEITGEAKGCTLDGSILTSGDEIGTVTVNVSVAEDDNYNALAATPIEVTITDKKVQTITAPDVTVTFGDTDKSVSAETDGDGELSYAVKEGSEDLIDVNPKTGALTIKKAGTATVIVTATETMSYLGASKEVTVEVKKQEEPNVEPPEAKATISMNAGLKVTQKGSKIKVEWGKVKEADGYDVYLAYCSKKFGKPIKNVNKNTVKSVQLGKIGKKKINLKKNFKVYVVAYKMVDGKKVRLAKSIVGHVVGHKNAKYTNAKKIKLAKAKYTVAVGKKVKIKAKTILVNKKKKQLSNKHAKEFRYATTDKQIASVSKSGKIKGVKKGTCTVYVYARNGMAKTVTVTVK